MTKKQQSAKADTPADKNESTTTTPAEKSKGGHRVGDSLWLHPHGPHRDALRVIDESPVDARVIYVHEDGTVNLLATGPVGDQVVIVGADVLEDGDEITDKNVACKQGGSLKLPAKKEADAPQGEDGKPDPSAGEDTTGHAGGNAVGGAPGNPAGEEPRPSTNPDPDLQPKAPGHPLNAPVPDDDLPDPKTPIL